MDNAAPTDTADVLNSRYADTEAQDLVARMIGEEFPGRIALVSSFGTGSALLLDLVARVDRSTPVLFLDTGKHFGETLRYRDQLVAKLGLTDLRVFEPDPAMVSKHDPHGILWMRQPDHCCYLRKVQPLERALAGFDAWITGRRRQQGGARTAMPRIEIDEGRVKINPLADWPSEDVEDYFAPHQLPPHPLEEDGFLSIGCLTCTDRVAPGEGPRAGRWRNGGKTECGVHLPREAFKDFGADI